MNFTRIKDMIPFFVTMFMIVFPITDLLGWLGGNFVFRPFFFVALAVAGIRFRLFFGYEQHDKIQCENRIQN